MLNMAIRRHRCLPYPVLTWGYPAAGGTSAWKRTAGLGWAVRRLGGEEHGREMESGFVRWDITHGGMQYAYWRHLE